MNARASALVLAAVTSAPLGAAAQTCDRGWIIDLDYGPGRSAVSPDNPSVRVTILARFAPNRYSYAVGGFRVSVDAGEPGWSEPQNLPPLLTGANPGTVSGPSVTGIIGGQLHFPAGGIFADPSNPIAAWSAVWTANDFRARQVPLATRTTRFDLYYQHCSCEQCGIRATEAVAVIEVAAGCYADCDTSTGPGVLDIFDFLCFQNNYDSGDPYACDCDTRTGPGVCDVFDFICFQNAFAAGCP